MQNMQCKTGERKRAVPAATIEWTRWRVNLVVEMVRRTRPALLAMIGGNPRTCIFSTRVACGVFSRLGIVNRPLPVELTVANPTYTRQLAGEAAAEGEPASFYIGTGPPQWAHCDAPPGSGWDGHLVCLVENRLILDLSIDQVNRPQYGIELEAAVIEPDAESMRSFLGGDGFLGGIARGCLIQYRRTNDRGYLAAGDWDREHTREAVLGICDGIVAGLRHYRWPSFGARPRAMAGKNAFTTQEVERE